MEEGANKQNNRLLIILLVLLNILAIGLSLSLWLTSRIEENKTNKVSSEETNKTSTQQAASESTHTEVTTGLGTLSLEVPDGWENVISEKQADFLWVGGKDQQSIIPGQAPKIDLVEGFGTDSPSVFSLYIQDKPTDVVVPQGVVTDYPLVNAKEGNIVGKKYFYEYLKDGFAGIGYKRPKGDKDYVWEFDIGNNKQLSISYSVYAQDPRNFVVAIENMIDSIRLND